MKKTVAETLRGFRRAKDMSQTDIGESIGFSTQHVCDLERGKRRLTFRILRSILGALGELARLEELSVDLAIEHGWLRVGLKGLSRSEVVKLCKRQIEE